MDEGESALSLTTVEIEVDRVDDNPLSANVQDEATFERLKAEIAEHGLLEVPVVKKNGDRFTLVSGHHRFHAWQSLGHKMCEVRLWKPKKGMTLEEEFNIVNNMNTIRGSLHRAELIGTIRQQNLDPTKIDVFKYPATALFPSLSKSDQQKVTEKQRDAARLHQLKLDVALEVAKAMYDGENDAVICFAANNHLAAVVRLSGASKGDARNLAHALKEPLKELVASMFAEVEDGDG